MKTVNPRHTAQSAARVFCCRPWLIVSLLIFSATPFWAQGGPPLRTDDPGTPGDGNWEINIGLTTDRRSTEREFEAPILDVNYGVGDRIQLKFEVPFLVLGTSNGPTRSGLGNSLAGVKWRFYEDKTHGLSLSTYPQFEFNNPTNSVDRGLASRGKKFLLPFEITKKVGPVDVNGEVGYNFAQTGPDDWIAGLAFGWQANQRWELLSEVYRKANVGSPEHEATFDFGGRTRLTESLRLIFMAGRSFSGSESGQPQLIGYLGVQILLSRKHPNQ